MRSFHLGSIGLVFAMAPFAGANVALTPTGSSGGQNFDNLFGMDFNVNSSIQVNQLGVFDNGADGVLNTDSSTQPIVIQLWNRSTGVPVETVDFGAGTGNGTDTTVGGGMVFFKPITPLVLPAGSYYISEDYSSAEQFFNSGGNASTAPTPDASGAITFVGGGRASNSHGQMYDQNVADNSPPGVNLPDGLTTTSNGFIDGGPANRYAGPDFTFTVPEPASLGLLSVGALSFLARRRRA